MDSTYHHFREIMKIVEKEDNDTQLGVHIREYYNTIWKREKGHHLEPPTPKDS